MLNSTFESILRQFILDGHKSGIWWLLTKIRACQTNLRNDSCLGYLFKSVECSSFVKWFKYFCCVEKKSLGTFLPIWEWSRKVSRNAFKVYWFREASKQCQRVCHRGCSVSLASFWSFTKVKLWCFTSPYDRPRNHLNWSKPGNYGRCWHELESERCLEASGQRSNLRHYWQQCARAIIWFLLQAVHRGSNQSSFKLIIYC